MNQNPAHACCSPHAALRPVVYVVDDDPVVRKSVAFLLDILDVEVCPLETAEAFLATYRPGCASCLILDMRMPGMSGLELQEELQRRQLDIPIIFVSGHGDIPMTVRAIRGGALDFLTKPYSDQDLLDRVQAALKQDRARQQSRREMSAQRARYALLTPREVEVLNLIVQGHTNKEMARLLDISVKTVESHRARIMEKMKVESLAELCLVRQSVLADQAAGE
ncbi:MAG: hypothetical protein RIR00_1018 [Pseudomonadota bacterium]|jgi:FixJ family two-component response regulator